jgi:hypothetical protein
MAQTEAQSTEQGGSVAPTRSTRPTQHPEQVPPLILELLGPRSRAVCALSHP